MRAHSFRVQVDIEDTPDESRVHFLADAEAPLPAEAIDAVVQVFATAARWGMFSCNPASSTIPMRADVTTLELGVEHCAFLLIAWGLQPCVWNVMLNMLHHDAAIVSVLTSVRLKSAAGDSRRIDTVGILDAPCSVAAVRPGIAVRSRRNLRDCREPVIRIEFQDDLTDDDLKRLAPAFLAWDDLVTRGGFVEDFGHNGGQTYLAKHLPPQQTYLAAPNVVEHLLYGYSGEADGFNAIVNLAARLNALFRPVVSLEIE
jgi:hypothetical protein